MCWWGTNYAWGTGLSPCFIIKLFYNAIKYTTLGLPHWMVGNNHWYSHFLASRTLGKNGLRLTGAITLPSFTMCVVRVDGDETPRKTHEVTIQESVSETKEEPSGGDEGGKEVGTGKIVTLHEKILVRDRLIYIRSAKNNRWVHLLVIKEVLWIISNPPVPSFPNVSVWKIEWMITQAEVGRGGGGVGLFIILCCRFQGEPKVAWLVDCNTSSNGACRNKHNQATTYFLSSQMQGTVLDAGIYTHRRLGGPMWHLVHILNPNPI